MKLREYRGRIQSNLQESFKRDTFEKGLVDYKGLMLFIGGGVPKFEFLDTPAREFSKTWSLVSTKDTYRAAGKKIINKISRENFENSIVEKESLLPTNDHIEIKLRECRGRIQSN